MICYIPRLGVFVKHAICQLGGRLVDESDGMPQLDAGVDHVEDVRRQRPQPRRDEERLVGVRLGHRPQPQAQNRRLEREGLRRLQVQHLIQHAAAAEARVGRLDPDPSNARRRRLGCQLKIIILITAVATCKCKTSSQLKIPAKNTSI